MPALKGHKKAGGRKKGVKNIDKGNPYKVTIDMLMMCFINEQFYVYEHYWNGELFYIGKGVNGRAWNKSPGCRNNNWQTFVEAINYDYEIRIVCAGLSEEEALAIERVLIKFKQPKCNIVYLSDTQQIDLFENINNNQIGI